jgi:hypothetical protein
MDNLNSFFPIRHLTIGGKILLIDGLTGTGKTMVMRIVSGLSNIQFPKFDYTIEHICILYSLNRIDLNSAITLLRLKIDQSRYDYSISREVNFRYRDLSSILHSPDRFELFLNLFKSDDYPFDHEIDPKTFTLITHQLLDSSNVLEMAYPSKIHRILCLRHPLYLFDHWNSYIDKHGKSTRDFTIWFNDNDAIIPWFIPKNNKAYQDSDDNSKSAIAISILINRSLDFIAQRPEKTVVVDFENFVLNPEPYVTKILDLLPGSKSKILDLLRKENIPRLHINNSINKKIYLKYGSNNLRTNQNHKENYSALKRDVFLKLNTTARNEFSLAIDRYEERFKLWF